MDDESFSSAIYLPEYMTMLARKKHCESSDLRATSAKYIRRKSVASDVFKESAKVRTV